MFLFTLVETGTLLSLLGGVPANLFFILLIMMGTDVAAGLLRAVVKKEFELNIFLEGLAKKAGYLLVLVCAFSLDLTVAGGLPVGLTGAVLYFIGVEAVSLLGQLSYIGVPVPKNLSKKAQQQKEEAEKDDNSKIH